MSGIFPKEAYQYDHAQARLPIYLKKYKDSEWELRSTIRSDTLARCEAGLPVKKIVQVRRPKKIEVTFRQMELVLLALNRRKAFSERSRDILFTIDEFDDTKKGFNSGTIALKLFGPSDKYYEIGKNQQNVKRIIRHLTYHNVLLLEGMKYYKLPVWSAFMVMVREADRQGKFKKVLQW